MLIGNSCAGRFMVNSTADTRPSMRDAGSLCVDGDGRGGFSCDKKMRDSMFTCHRVGFVMNSSCAVSFS